ncbi:Protein FYV8 [Clarias magur]|uniref:Protein FYV8 n=1 Tax=Clarias magur TaxID=1594786 RepID=A0A8J4WT12_CLAMG|nr:Protein FYV8 [Clarias magur]
MTAPVGEAITSTAGPSVGTCLSADSRQTALSEHYARCGTVHTFQFQLTRSLLLQRFAETGKPDFQCNSTPVGCLR